MICRMLEYADAARVIGAADVIAFGDDSAMSRSIQLATGSDIGHLAVVRRVFRSRGHVRLVEALARGVVETWLHERVEEYERARGGRVYWLRLDPDFTAQVAWGPAFAWLDAQVGKRYGPGQAIRSALPTLSRWFGNKESFARLHCSELVAGMFKAGGAPGFERWNASEATPQDLVRAQIYASARRLGMGARLQGFNSMPPTAMANGVNTNHRTENRG